jgi:hypothetical protein
MAITLILGIPSLVTIDAYIGCRIGDMTITNLQSQKILTLDRPAKPFIDTKTPLCAGQEEDEDMFQNIIHPILTIDTNLALKEIDENTFLSN